MSRGITRSKSMTTEPRRYQCEHARSLHVECVLCRIITIASDRRHKRAEENLLLSPTYRKVFLKIP